MPYDEELAERVRAELGPLDGLSEMTTPDGLAFLIGGNAAVWLPSRGGIAVRVDPDENEELIRTTTASKVEVNGRSINGWVRVSADDVRTAGQVKPWVRRAAGIVSELPPRSPEPEHGRGGPSGT